MSNGGALEGTVIGNPLVLAQFVENERPSCPFYRFTLEIELDGGPLWLR